MKDRRFLLLQGPSSRFFALLGKAIRAKGAQVMRAGIAPADRLFWSRSAGSYLALRCAPGDYEHNLKEIFRENRITDLVMLGDGRTAHRAAIAAARSMGSDAPIPWIVEHGLIRPDLIHIAPWGIGARSPVPRLFASGAAPAGPVDPLPAFSHSFLRYAAYDLAANVTNLLFSRISYPEYRHHALDGPVAEYAGWLAKSLSAPVRARRRSLALARIAGASGRSFLFPLQLATDFQIRRDGTGEPMADICRSVIAEFARLAPPDAQLIVKVHPLDNGRARWRNQVSGWASDAGVAARVVHLDGGAVEPLLSGLSGMITVNSTAGLAAILAGVPTRVLGKAVYDLPGLTHRSGAETFWTAPEPPDTGQAEAFRRFIVSQFHVSGAFDGPGAGAGAAALAGWLENPPPAASHAAETGR